MVKKTKRYKLKDFIRKRRWLWTPYALVMLPILPIVHVIEALLEYEWSWLREDYVVGLKLVFHWVEEEHEE